MFNAMAVSSAILFAAVCVLWVRSRAGWDRAAWMYCRYLPDKSIASDEAYLSSNRDGVTLVLMRGHAPPRPVDLVRGYDINADESGGRPRVWFNHDRYDGLENWAYLRAAQPTFRWPVRWETFRRQQPKDDDDSFSVTLTISHWLLALLLLVMPAFSLNRFRKARRARNLGLCASCGYDLRATPERCPECGAVPEQIAAMARRREENILSTACPSGRESHE